MLLRQKPSFFSKNLVFLAAVFAMLDNTAFAHLASNAAQSYNLSNQNNFGGWYNPVLIFGAFFCASIFWWRREKNQDEPAERRFPGNKGKDRDKGEERRSSQNSNDGTDQNNKEVNANVASWIKNNISNPISSSALRKQNNAAEAPVVSALVFKIPAAPPPIIPLPTSKDQSVIEAAEKIQHFNATEEEREAAINVLIDCKSRNAVEALTQVALYDESARLRISALNGLSEFDHDSVFEPILLTCADPAREVRAAAARAFARLNVNRGEAFTRIVESGDPERLRLSSMVCIDAGLAKHGLSRLAHYNIQQANDAFAMVRLLIAAGQFAPITDVINNMQDIRASMIMIKALQAIKPVKMMPVLYQLTGNNTLNPEVKRALSELNAELSTSK